MKKVPGPGFEPGLLRPQRSVLTTRRSRLTTLLKADVKGKITSLTSNNILWVLYGESSLLFNLKFAMKKKKTVVGEVQKKFAVKTKNIPGWQFSHTLENITVVLKKLCRDQDSNLGYCGHNAES